MGLRCQELWLIHQPQIQLPFENRLLLETCGERWRSFGGSHGKKPADCADVVWIGRMWDATPSLRDNESRIYEKYAVGIFESWGVSALQRDSAYPSSYMHLPQRLPGQRRSKMQRRGSLRCRVIEGDSSRASRQVYCTLIGEICPDQRPRLKAAGNRAERGAVSILRRAVERAAIGRVLGTLVCGPKGYICPRALTHKAVFGGVVEVTGRLKDDSGGECAVAPSRRRLFTPHDSSLGASSYRQREEVRSKLGKALVASRMNLGPIWECRRHRLLQRLIIKWTWMDQNSARKIVTNHAVG